MTDLAYEVKLDVVVPKHKAATFNDIYDSFLDRLVAAGITYNGETNLTNPEVLRD